MSHIYGSNKIENQKEKANSTLSTTLTAAVVAPHCGLRHRSRNAAACSPSPTGSGRGARVKSAKLGSPPRDFPRSWTCSSRELTVRGSVDSPVGEIPWFLCASAEELHARGPLPVKEIAIYYDRWEGEGFALFSPRYG